jgi:hypothetical protein|mmetsp:Transcript_8939/g.29807  ORF Transcript_8939/g.29807 Transcript_8939/m.29807 type:complete len:91 (+) Transcript_8939:68-340(+)
MVGRSVGTGTGTSGSVNPTLLGTRILGFVHSRVTNTAGDGDASGGDGSPCDACSFFRHPRGDITPKGVVAFINVTRLIGGRAGKLTHVET